MKMNEDFVGDISNRSEYDGRDIFSSFIQYEWSGDAKGVADHL